MVVLGVIKCPPALGLVARLDLGGDGAVTAAGEHALVGRERGLRGLALSRYLILPASLPAYLAGLKQGWAFSWRSMLAGELLVVIIGHPSLGLLLNTAQDDLDLSGAIAIMIVILLIGIVVDMAFTKADLAVRRRRGLLDTGAAS